MFFSKDQVIVYDNFEEKLVKIKVNGEEIELNNKQSIIYFSELKNLGYYYNDKLIDLTSKLNTDIYNRIEQQ